MKTTMIRFLIYSIVIILSNAPAFSQSFNFGIKTGVNASYFHGGRYFFTEDEFRLNIDPKPTIRFTGGIFTRANVTDNFALQGEALYTTKGARFDQTIDIQRQPMNVTGGVTLGYIEIPIFIRFSTAVPDRGPLFYTQPGMVYYTYAGGYYGYRTRATFNGELSGEVIGVPFNEEFRNRVWYQFSNSDYGIVIGAGFEYAERLGSGYLIDLRYSLGLSDIGDDPRSGLSIKNGTVSLTVGIIF
jgi:hypothetical protein